MLIDEVWAHLASEHDVVLGSPVGPGSDTVTLSGSDFASTEVRVMTFTYPLGPSRVRYYAAGARGTSLLLIAPAASSAALDAAGSLGISVLLLGREAGPLTGRLIDSSGKVLDLFTATAPRPVRERTGPKPWGTFSIAFQLLARPASSHRELADRAGVTQPHVTQTLKKWSNDLVRRDDDGNVAATPELRGWLVARYPRRETLQTRWLTLDSPVRAAEHLVGALTRAGRTYAFTGDVAADHLAPWARPQTCSVLTDSPLDLDELGMTPTATGANVFLTVTKDALALRNRQQRQGTFVVEPWRVWVSLAQSNNTAAAEHLEDELLQGRVAG